MEIKWKINSAKTAGKLHLREKPPIPCQDSVLTKVNNGVSVIALSDGCGSSSISEIGADITTKVLCNLFTEHFDELYELDNLKLKSKIITEINKNICSYIKNNSNVIKQFKKLNEDHKEKFDKSWKGFRNASTLYEFTIFDATLQFVAEKDDKLIIGRLGDGIIGGVENNNLSIISSEDKIYDNLNATWYPTTILLSLEINNGVWDNFEIIKKDNISNSSLFFIISDGLEDIFVNSEYNREKNMYVDSVLDIIKEEDLYNLLENVYNKERYITDDLSIAIMSKENVKIENIVIREYDANGKTIANNKIISLDLNENEDQTIDYNNVENDDVINKEDLIKYNNLEHEFIEKDVVEKLKNYIQNDEYKLKRILNATNVILSYILENESVNFKSVKTMLSPTYDECDFVMLIEYWRIISLFNIDYNNEIISKR